MGSSLSLSGFRRPRPEPEDPSPEEGPRDAKRVKAAPYVFSDFAALGSAMALVAGVLGCLAIYLMPEAWLP